MRGRYPKQTVHPLSDTEGTGPKFGTWDSDGQCQITAAVSCTLFCLFSSEPNA